MNNAFLGSEMLGWNIGKYLAALMFLMISIFICLNCYLSSWFERASAREEDNEEIITKSKDKKVKTIQIQGLPIDEIAKKRTTSKIVKK
jgi:hypothetical protein